MTAWRKLDKLIDWYEQNRPTYDGPIRVGVRRRTAMQFAKPKVRGGPLYYRDYEIVTRDTPRPRPKAAALPIGEQQCPP